MKYTFIISILLGLSLQADYVKETIGVCSSAETLTELSEYSETHLLEKGGLELELWLMQHECMLIDKKTHIEVLNYTGKKTEVLKILLKKTNDIVYAFSKGIQIEQPGQENILYKF